MPPPKEQSSSAPVVFNKACVYKHASLFFKTLQFLPRLELLNKDTTLTVKLLKMT